MILDQVRGNAEQPRLGASVRRIKPVASFEGSQKDF